MNYLDSWLHFKALNNCARSYSEKPSLEVMEVSQLSVQFHSQIFKLEEDFNKAMLANPEGATQVFVENQLAQNLTALNTLVLCMSIELELEELYQTT